MASCLRCDRGNPPGCCINVSSWPAEHLPAGMYRIYLELELRNVNEERTRKPSFLGKYQRKALRLRWRSWRFEAETATTLLLSDVSGRVVDVTDRNTYVPDSDSQMPCRLPRRLFSRQQAGLVSYSCSISLFSGMCEVGVPNLSQFANVKGCKYGNPL
jgi:hypothetical protein